METPSYELLVLLGGFGLLMFLVMRGRSIFVAAPLCALFILLFSGADPLLGMTGKFMSGFADYLRRFYLLFALGAAFGKLMEDSGAALTIARSIVICLGSAAGVPGGCTVVCSPYLRRGVALCRRLFGLSLGRAAVSRGQPAAALIPAAIAFGSVTFTMTTAGSPEIQNLIPIPFLGTDAMAGWPASLIVAAFMFITGQWYMEWSLNKALARGECFEPRSGDAWATASRRNRIPPSSVRLGR